MMWILCVLGLVLSIIWITLGLVDHGTYRWSSSERNPKPLLFFALCPDADGWTKFEVGIAGRQFWMTWGH